MATTAVTHQTTGTKRQREEEGEGKEEDVEFDDRWVAFVAIDDDRLVKCDLQTMELARPALYLQATKDKPVRIENRLRVFQTSFTRTQLVAFVSSFNLGILCLTKHVSMSEMLLVFQQQSVAFSDHVAMPVDKPPRGVGFVRHENTVGETLPGIFSRLAMALASWPRLEVAMDCTMGTKQRPVKVSRDMRNMISGRAVSATRAWIRFATKPPELKKADLAAPNLENLCLELASNSWLSQNLYYLGYLYHHMGLPEKDAESFNKISDYVSKSHLDDLQYVSIDFAQESGAHQRFVEQIRTRVSGASYTFAGPHQPTVQFAQRATKSERNLVQFCRACVNLSFTLAAQSPDYGTLLGNGTVDRDGGSPERDMLAKALELHDIKIVRWASPDEMAAMVASPLVFPPGFSSSGSALEGCALLEFGR